jgi:hypothetical protein
MARALALLAIAGLLTSCTRARAPHLAVQNPRLIVLVTIDTLRADRLGAYGSTAGLTPRAVMRSSRQDLSSTAAASAT